MQSSEIILRRLVNRLKIGVPDTFRLGAILCFWRLEKSIT